MSRQNHSGLRNSTEILVHITQTTKKIKNDGGKESQKRLCQMRAQAPKARTEGGGTSKTTETCPMGLKKKNIYPIYPLNKLNTKQYLTKRVNLANVAVEKTLNRKRWLADHIPKSKEAPPDRGATMQLGQGPLRCRGQTPCTHCLSGCSAVTPS